MFLETFSDKIRKWQSKRNRCSVDISVRSNTSDEENGSPDVAEAYLCDNAPLLNDTYRSGVRLLAVRKLDHDR